jgi:hypothetical protein
MLNDFYELCLKRLRGQRDLFISRIASNAASNIEDYRFVCGKIQGLQESEDMLKETFDKLERN